MILFSNIEITPEAGAQVCRCFSGIGSNTFRYFLMQRLGFDKMSRIFIYMPVTVSQACRNRAVKLEKNFIMGCFSY